MRTTARLVAAATTVTAVSLLGAPAAMAQESPACAYPFDCRPPVIDLDLTKFEAPPAQDPPVGRPQTPTQLPFTGGEVVLIALAGGTAIAGGAALVAVGRRRAPAA